MATQFPVKTKPVPPWQPYLALAVGVLALSMTSIFVRWSSAPGPVTAFYRMLIAGVLLTPFVLLSNKVGNKNNQTGGKLSKQLLWLPVLGGILVACDHALLSASVAHTRIANLTLMNNIAPLWVALAAWLLWKERLKLSFWLGLALTMSGAVIVIGYDLLLHPAFSFGDGLAVASSLFYAAYFMVTQRGREKINALAYMWVVNLASSVILLVICLASDYALLGYPWQTWAVFAAAGVISQGIGYLAVGYALGSLPASVVAPTMVAQPLLTTLLAIPLTGELLQPAQWIGGAAVLTGIYLVIKQDQKIKPSEEELKTVVEVLE